MKTFERRQVLIELLCERRYDKVDNLAFELGVSWRTICRDIQALSLSYPIYTECSRGKAGVYVQEGYYLGKQYLHKEEAELLKRLMSKAKGEDKERLNRILKRFARPNNN